MILMNLMNKKSLETLLSDFLMSKQCYFLQILEACASYLTDQTKVIHSFLMRSGFEYALRLISNVNQNSLIILDIDLRNPFQGTTKISL